MELQGRVIYLNIVIKYITYSILVKPETCLIMRLKNGNYPTEKKAYL